MKIGIDARMMGVGYGIGRYIEQLILNLQKIDHDNQYIFFVKKDFSLPAQAGLKISDYSRFRTVVVDIPWYGWEEQVKIPKIIKKEKVDLMHFPHWNVPLFYNEPFVVTIHDLIMFHFPRPEATTLGPLKFWFKDLFHRIILKNAIKKAKHVITTSEFTKQDLYKTLGAPMAKMTTVYQAPANLNPKSEIRNPKLVMEKYNIKKPYVLYVGSAYPHKNLDGLLKAWKIFLDKYNLDFQLVLVGKRSLYRHAYKKLRQQYNNLTIEQSDSVIFTGFVPDDELSTLYRKAQLYIFPSLYEGFGLPPLEAMVHGVPVASSNRTCLPEILGEGAIYFDPENIEQMADIINTGLTDENIRHDLSVSGPQELQKYSSQKLAKETLAVYKLSCG
ncbi:MAG: glycosyltransferase family 1 protein [bacterium]|nr:glycosyltransferase family 1 protein [bacterium]